MRTTRIAEFEEAKYKFLVIRAERGRSCREVFVHGGSFLDTSKYLEETFSVKFDYNSLWTPPWDTLFYVAPLNFCAYHLARASMIHTLIFAIPEGSKFVTISYDVFTKIPYCALGYEEKSDAVCEVITRQDDEEEFFMLKEGPRIKFYENFQEITTTDSVNCSQGSGSMEECAVEYSDKYRGNLKYEIRPVQFL
jgi:hypothetical protein